MQDSTMSRPDPSHATPAPAPPSVRYAQVVLFLQGSIWAMGAIGGVTGTVDALTAILHGKPWALLILAAGWSAVAGGMATVDTLLAVHLGRGGSRRARKAVIAVELAMTCFGVLWFFNGIYTVSGLPADMVTLAGLVGGGLSLAAALALMSRRARQYAAPRAARAEDTDLGPASGASFSRRPALAPA
jgi:hypothetical protein